MKTRSSKKTSKSPTRQTRIQVRVASGAQASYTATQAKNEFGHLLDQAIHGKIVFITKHDSPRAVLISLDKYEMLANAPQLELNTLSEQFDALLARMQSAQSRSGMTAAFNASSKDLGKAALPSLSW